MTTAHHEQDSKKRIWQKLLAGGLLLALMGLVVLFGAQRIGERLQPTPPAPRPPLAVETLQLEASPFMVTRRYTGSVVSAKRALISAQLSARVKTVHYREGETVEKGNLLITLDGRGLRAEVGLLEATARRIRADLDYWRVQAARDEKLLRGKTIASQKRDQSKRMVASLEASLRANEYALAAARTKLGYTLIHAPFSGAIQRLETEVGELATPGKVLVELIAMRPLKAVFSLPQKDLSDIIPEARGDSSRAPDVPPLKARAPAQHGLETLAKRAIEVRLIFPFLNKTIITYMRHIYPALDSTTRNATFDVRLPENLEGLLPGMTVDAIVVLARYERALVLPREAIRIHQGGTGVYTVEENIARWRPVSIGQAQARQVRIVAGLGEGEKVIVTPHPLLQDGTKVRPRNNWRTAQ